MAQVKELIDNFTGQTEAQKKASEEVATMVQIANAKLDAMEADLRDKFRNKELEGQMEIVGDRMGAFSREYRVNYSDGNVSKAVDELVSTIMELGEGDTRSLISKIITNSLSAMFTTVSITEEEKKLFIVVMEGAALVRYDFDVWKSAEQDSSFFQHCQSVVAITYARSVVDHTKVSEDELNDAINRYLGGSASLDDIIAYKKKLIELLKLNVNSKDDIQIAASDNSSNLIEMMSSISPDVEKADYFINNKKVTAESAYVNSLLEKVGGSHA